MGVAITGVGSFLPDILDSGSGAPCDRSIPSMAYRAVKSCLHDAGRGMNAVNAIVTSSVDLWDGKTASNIGVTEAVGAVMKSETRIGGDGLLALMHGAMMVLSGHYTTVLVVAHGKSSEGDVDAISNWAFDPVYQQPLGVTHSQSLALQTQAFCGREGGARSVAEIASNLGIENGSVAAPQGDGACAVLLEPGDGPVMLEGFGYDLDRHYLGDRDLARSEGLERAAGRAMQAAGGLHPQRDIDRFFWSISSAAQLALWSEAVSVWSLEQATAELFDLRHQLQWSGLPPFVAGLQRMVSAVDEMRSGREVKRSFVQGCHGPAGQAQAVCVLASGRA